MKKKSDEQLMMAFSTEGNQSAFSELYQRHKAPLYRYFVRQLGTTQTMRAEELFQDVWFSVVDKRTNYQVTAKFTTWLYRIAHNKLVDYHRRALSENAYLQQMEVSESHEGNALEERKKRAIYDCMSTLPYLQREAFMLRFESDFSPAQISDIVSAGQEAIKTRLRHALTQLRKCLTSKLGERK